jgi:membrane associated rhomboid family serine protease
MKTEEYQAMGRTYNEAVAEAISSMGDLKPLFDQVSGNTRSVYINRLNSDDAKYCTLMIAAEYMLGWLFYLLSTQNPGNEFLLPFVVFGLVLGAALSIWPVVAYMTQKRQPEKVDTVGMPYRKQMRVALVSWIALSVVLLIVNAMTWYHSYVLWAVWPVIGIANWPVNIWLYHRLLVSGKYDAE